MSIFPSTKHFLLTVSTVTLASLSNLLGVCLSQAQAITINGGFELGNFTDWNPIGLTSIETSAFGSGPPQGIYGALLQTGVETDFNVFELDTALGLAGFPTDSLFNYGSMGGSVITTEVVDVKAGDTLSFQWNFLTNELIDPNLTRNDFAFFTVVPTLAPLTATVNQLADTNSTFMTSTTMSFQNETGFQTKSITFSSAGTFRLGFGVVDVGDFAATSGLLVDNVKLTPVPEPTSILGTAVMAGFWAYLKHKRSR
jgi:hypothetical protein